MHMRTDAELKAMTEGEQLIYLITQMDGNCGAVEKLIRETNTKDKLLHDKMDSFYDKIQTIADKKVSFKLFLASIVIIVGVMLSFSGVVYVAGCEISAHETRLSMLEKHVYSFFDFEMDLK